MMNAQILVSEQLNRQLINTTQEVTVRCIKYLANHYGFDADEAIRLVGLEMIKIERRAAGKEKAPKVVKEKVEKSSIPLPYNGEFNENCCFALRQNNGLYTQCPNVRKTSDYCKSCASKMQKTGSEIPEYGTIQQRMAVGIFEYVDPKGKKPTAFAKVMKRLKLTQEQVEEEAGKKNIIINPEHFVIVETEGKRGRPKSEKVPKEKGAKGRPKKQKKVLEVEGDDEDLFATLIVEAQISDNETDTPKKKSKKTEEEKEKEKQEREAKKKAEEEEKEAKRLAREQEREAKKKAEEEEKEAKRLAKQKEKEEREAKKKAEEEEKEAKKKAKEEERAAKKKKEEEKASKKSKKEEKSSQESNESKEEPKAEEKNEDEEEPDTVKKITYEGVKYLKSKKSGLIYDYSKYVKEQEIEVIGKWDDKANKIIFNKQDDEDDEEEEEEEYEM